MAFIVPGGFGGVIAPPSGGEGGGGDEIPPFMMALYYADEGITLNGSNVSQWNDLSGNGRHLSQATAGKQPLFITDGDGFPGVAFFNSILRSATDWGLSQPFTYFLVLKQTTWDWDRFIVCGGDANTGIIKQSGGSEWVAGYSGSLGPSGGVGLTNRAVVKILFDGLSSTCHVNGVLTGTGDPGPGGFNGLCLGWDYLESIGSSYDGIIHALVVCDSSMTTEQGDEINANLMMDWGIS